MALSTYLSIYQANSARSPVAPAVRPASSAVIAHRRGKHLLLWHGPHALVGPWALPSASTVAPSVSAAHPVTTASRGDVEARPSPFRAAKGFTTSRVVRPIWAHVSRAQKVRTQLRAQPPLQPASATMATMTASWNQTQWIARCARSGVRAMNQAQHSSRCRC